MRLDEGIFRELTWMTLPYSEVSVLIGHTKSPRPTVR